MLETYAAWLDGTTESDLRAIKSAMEGPCTASIPSLKRQVQKPSLVRAGTRLALEKGVRIEVFEGPRNKLAERERERERFEPGRGT
jgi:hypothetical protein